MFSQQQIAMVAKVALLGVTVGAELFEEVDSIGEIILPRRIRLR